MGRFLLSPVIFKGNGTGHLKRCIELAEKLNARILTHQDIQCDPVIEVPAERTLPIRDLASLGNWDFILLDRRATSLAEAKKLAHHGCLIGLDEGGPSRSYIPYLIDSLPADKNRSHPNLSCLSFLDLPPEGLRRKNGLVYPFRKILITFGGEDPAGLTLSLLRAVARSRPFFDCLGCAETVLTVVVGPAFSQETREVLDNPESIGQHLPEIRILLSPEKLKETLHQHDLVITSFGLTCFESLAAGVPVILFNPSRYHRDLGRQGGLPDIGVGKPSINKLRRLLRHRGRFVDLLKDFQESFKPDCPSLSEWLTQLSKPKRTLECPGCGNVVNPVIARFPDSSFVHCSRCDLVYLLSFSGQKSSYDEEYFNEQYRQQYGRTYLEDFANIKDLSRQRLLHIKRTLGFARTLGFVRTTRSVRIGRSVRLAQNVADKTLLDVGCALGPFLQAARDEGLTAYGIDISETSVRYVRDQLDIPAQKISFEDYEGEGVDIVTMWYVIEHFADLRPILAKVNRLLPIGGIFAFSTPNRRGISGWLNQEKFLQNSPRDHQSVWSPKAARQLMKRYGLRVKKIRYTGHHPERFPWPKRMSRGGLLWLLVDALSRFFCLGDTFETYAVKKRNIDE